MRRACFARVEELSAARAAREERRIPDFTEKTDSALLVGSNRIVITSLNRRQTGQTIILFIIRRV